MSTRRLSISAEHAIMNLEPSADPVNVEVPAGETEYRIFEGPETGDSSEYIFHLRHRGSQALVIANVEAAGESAPRLRTCVIHHAPETRAETIVRTLSRDQAFPHYEGVIIIEEGANRSESYLNHHSLLLGTTAKSWTLPSLEIKADDVKCSHAATMRTITELDLFYLRSRGLDESASRDVLIEAFLGGE